MKLVLPALLALSLAAPAAASASVVRTSLLTTDPAPLIKVDHKGKHRGKGHGRGRGRQHFNYDDRDDRYDERRAYHQGLRDGRREARGDYYEPGRHDGYPRFDRGDYLPPHYRSHVIDDYDRYGFPPPPRGCRYVQVGQNTYLTQIATGLILNAFLGGGY
ncbi:MAG: RcnB family protein [Proteobacteria bacterium]|nr:RcnB family protein [Pseudomonadota bacterium]